MIVRFTEPTEFLSELERDPHAVARKLVRLTKVARPAMQGAITTVSVVATAKVRSGGESDYDLVRLDVFVGDLWGAGDRDAAVQASASELVRGLEEKILDAGFGLAAGFYSELAPA